MQAAPFLLSTVGVALYYRFKNRQGSTTPVQDQRTTATTTSTTLKQQTAREANEEAEFESMIQSVLTNILSEEQPNLRYVHDFYDVYQEYSEQCECEFGFKRPNFKKDDMVGRVTYHDKHIFVLTKMRANEWEKDFDKMGFAAVLKRGLSKNMKGVRCKISYAEAVDGEEVPSEESNNHTILVLPDMLKFTGVNETNISQIAEALSGKQVHGATFEKETMTASQILICAHANKDMRCGICGPRLYQAFAEQLPKSVVADREIEVRRVTHLGGHKFAGNLIIYQQNRNGKVFGDWYGYVDESDIPTLISEHLGEGKIVKKLWRGRCGMTAELSEKFLSFN